MTALTRIPRRLRDYWHDQFTHGELPTLFIALGLLWMPALALRAAAWADGLTILLPIVSIALIISFLLARSQFSELNALLLSTLYGLATIIAAHAIVLPGPLSPRYRLTELADRINRWWEDVSSGVAGTDNLIFALFLSVLFWYLAHNTLWHIFRLDRIWRAIIPPGLVLVINHYQYEGTVNLDYYLIGFLFFALLLIILAYINSREYEWRRQRIAYSSKLRRHFLRLGTAMALVILLVGSVMPPGNTQNNWDEIQDFLGGDAFKEIRELWNRLFSSLEGRGIATTDYYGGDRLDLTGSIQLGEDPVLSVRVPAGDIRYYWRSTVFDTYDGRGWEHQRSVRAYKDSEGMRFNIGTYTSRRDITQDITLYISASSLLYAAPQPQYIHDVAVEAELNCILGGSNCVRESEQADVALIRARTPLRENDRYTITSSMSVATADELRSAGTDYPDWVANTYLQGSNRVSADTRNLTQQIIAINSANTPYDKAKAIEQWLRNNIVYNESIPAPPYDQDPIDWFLFDIREGYCNYYASAMIMMLRSEGVPARMAAGFAEGTRQSDGYLVRENDAHTWVEVYFPDYGWVEFEPTADEQPIDRPGDRSFQDNFPTFTPMPTATLTPTPTNTLPPPTPDVNDNAPPTSTPTPTEAPIDDSQGATPTPQFQVTETPFVSPTPTPSPSLMDVNAGDDNDSNLLRTLLIILASMLVTITAILTIGGIMLWWVEYRGLGGLNPIQKAYARLEIYGHWLGLGLHNRQTPEERRQVLVDSVPEGEPPINTIAHLYTHNRFAPPISEEEQDEAEYQASRAWRDARLSFILEKFRRRRPK